VRKIASYTKKEDPAEIYFGTMMKVCLIIFGVSVVAYFGIRYTHKINYWTTTTNIIIKLEVCPQALEYGHHQFFMLFFLFFIKSKKNGHGKVGLA